jgi:hypothetical protein
LPSYPFNGSDSQGNEVLAQAKEVFESDKCFISVERHVLFVCGGRTDQVNARTRFLEFAKDNFPKLRILVAEDAYGDFLADSKRRVINLALFEKILAELADCILIFPESPGSFAELGFFSAYQPIFEKTLAVSPTQFQAEDSFLALGPLAVINRHSDFSPTLIASADHAQTHSDISARLARLANVKRRQHLPLTTWEKYSLKEKFFIAFEVLRILRVMHTATLSHVLLQIFGGYVNKEELKHIVSVLVAAAFVARAGDDERYLVAISQRTFIDVPSEDVVITSANSYLLKHHAELYNTAFG